MADSSRRTVETDWGNTNPAGVVAPSQGTQDAGYAAVKPPYQEHNWLFQLATNMLQNAEQNGIMQWKSTTAYTLNGTTKGSDGKTYLSIVASNTGNDPVLDAGTNWIPKDDGVRDFVSNGSYDFPKSNDTDTPLIIQWGESSTYSGGGNDVPVVFPKVFPNSALNVFGVVDHSALMNGNVSAYVKTGTLTGTGVTFILDAATGTFTNASVRYFAIGF